MKESLSAVDPRQAQSLLHYRSYTAQLIFYYIPIINKENLLKAKYSCPRNPRSLKSTLTGEILTKFISKTLVVKLACLTNALASNNANLSPKLTQSQVKIKKEAHFLSIDTITWAEVLLHHS